MDLGNRELSPCVCDQQKRYDDPQHVHEDKVEPEVDRVTQLTVGIAVSVLGVEIQHCPIQLAWKQVTGLENAAEVEH